MLRMIRLLPAIVAAALLTACTGPQSITVEKGVELPDVLQSDGVNGESDPGAAWKGADRSSLVVVVYGSSSCAPGVVDLTVQSPRSLAVEFAQSTDEICSADMAANTYRFDTPEGLATDGDVQLEMTFEYDGKKSTSTVTILE